MRIGINLLYLLPGVVGGTETYAEGLLAGFAQLNLQDEFVVFVNRESANWPLPFAPNFTRVVCPVDATSRGKRYLFEQFRLSRLLRLHGVDVVHSLGYVCPLLAPCPSVVAIHDLNYCVVGDEMPIARRLGLSFFVKKSAHRADHITALSSFSRSQIVRFLGVSESKVTVLGAAARLENDSPDDAAVLEPLGIGSPYIIAFSSQSPHKNIPLLLQAFALARQHYGLTHHLVLVGHIPGNAHFRSLVERDDESVRFTGYLGDSALAAVLRGAQLLVFPSLYEGFGLPVLEAMEVGVPVVCSNVASLPEVAGSASIMFDPFSVEEMASAIVKVAQDPEMQGYLRRKGFENCKRFSWIRSACKAMEVYRALVH